MFWNFVLCYPSWSSMFSSKSSTLPQGIISEPSMKHPCFSGKLIRNIDDHQCLHRNHQCFINVASMSYCCLFNEQAWFFDDDIIREEENIVRQFFKSSCIPLINMFGLFRCIGLFLFCAISESGCLTSNMVSFFDISILLSSFGVRWRPRSYRGSCQVGYIVAASWEPPIWSIRTAVSIICELCLWKTTLSDNLIYVFYSFWLARGGGPKLKTFAVNVERQRRKNYRRISAKVVAIRSLPLFF